LAGFCFCLSALASHASDTLQFENGDQLTGRFIAEKDGFLMFETEALGMIRVPANAAHVVRPEPADDPADPDPDAMRKRVQSLAEMQGIPPEQAEDLAVAIESAVKQEPGLLKSAVNQLVLDNPIIQFIRTYYPLRDWKTRLEFGYSLATADTEAQNFRVLYQAELHPPESRSRYRLSYHYQYGTQTDPFGVEVTNQDRTQAGARYRFELNKRLFLQNQLAYLQDRKIGIAHEVADNLGIGYTVIDRERLHVSLTPGGGVRYQETSGDTQREFIVSLYQDLEYRINDHLRIQQEGDVKFSPKDSDDYSYFVSAFLEHALSDNLNVNLRYSYTYTNIVPPGKSRIQDNLGVTLALNF